jgi:hypothetical protein
MAGLATESVVGIALHDGRDVGRAGVADRQQPAETVPGEAVR